jgi:hypothetical protein
VHSQILKISLCCYLLYCTPKLSSFLSGISWEKIPILFYNSYKEDAVLQEEKNVQQYPNEPRRRWFLDQEFDLIVWGDEGGEISSFQLCYHKQRDEHALVWRAREGFGHYKVDQGEPSPTQNLSPMMVDDGIVPMEWLQETFKAHSKEIPANIRNFVVKMLDLYAGGE